MAEMDAGSKIPKEYMIMPGRINVSDEAWLRAKEFSDDLLRQSGPDRIAGFVWFTMTRYQRSPSEPFVELGPSLELGGYRRADVPDGAIHSLRELEFIVAFSEGFLADYPQRLIDWIEADGSGHFVIR